jgi:hypothetical protein
MVAGLIVGALTGILVAMRLAQINDSLYTPFLQAELRLHLAAIYGLLMVIPGLIAGGLVLGRRKQLGIVAQGILLLIALLIFYYGRNWLSYHIWSRFGGFRWLLEIAGILGWGFACWILYKILLYLEENAHGWTVGIALIALGILLIWSGYFVTKVPEPSSQEAKRPAIPAPQPNVKVALIGIDGAWWEMIDPLMKAGRMPVFQSLVDRGVRSQCHTLIPTLSARIWNTIATGKNPEKHHITSFTVWTFPVTGVTLPLTRIPAICYELEWMLGHIIHWTPINSTFRMSEAIWNILSDAGLKVGVMNWWASYPAEPVNGFIVSDRALYDKTLRYVIGEKAHGDSRSVFPPQLLPELEPLVVDPMSIPADSITCFIHLNTQEDKDWYTNTRDYRIFDEKSETAMFKFSYPEDVTMVNAALYLLKHHGQPDFFAIYLDGMDSMEHKYLPYYFSERHPGAFRPQNIARLKDLVPEYYVYMDQVVGELLAAMDPQTIVIIVSDHGFEHGLQPNLNYNHINGPPGVFVIAGDHIKRGAQITTASVRDVTPTILELFGLPVGKDMDGRVVTEAFDMENVPTAWIDTYEYGNRERGRIEPSQMDEAIQERLRALGYTK